MKKRVQRIRKLAKRKAMENLNEVKRIGRKIRKAGNKILNEI
jgi:hypothetical protein